MNWFTPFLQRYPVRCYSTHTYRYFTPLYLPRYLTTFYRWCCYTLPPHRTHPAATPRYIPDSFWLLLPHPPPHHTTCPTCPATLPGAPWRVPTHPPLTPHPHPRTPPTPPPPACHPQVGGCEQWWGSWAAFGPGGWRCRSVGGNIIREGERCLRIPPYANAAASAFTRVTSSGKHCKLIRNSSYSNVFSLSTGLPVLPSASILTYAHCIHPHLLPVICVFIVCPPDDPCLLLMYW